MDNKALYAFLKAKGVTYFFHANTVSTSFTFMVNNGLMSRGLVEKKGCFQTKQKSDEIDKKYDVWDDIFIDSLDLHGFFPRQNLYGPVAFQFNIEFLLEDSHDIWITKDNPIYWNEKLTMEEKYFQGIDDLTENWDNFDRQKKMFTIRKAHEPSLFKYLEKIILDDPGVTIPESIHLLKEAVRSINEAVALNPLLKGKSEVRICQNCYCKDNYLDQVSVDELRSLFLPKEILSEKE